MPAITTAFVGALLLTFETWLTSNQRDAPADLAARFIHNQTQGLEWALGFDHHELRFEPHTD